MEFGETFAEAAARESFEEAGVIINPNEIKYVTTINEIELDKNYHHVGILMAVCVNKSDFTFKNVNPSKTSDWRWVKWVELVEYEPLFHPFKYIFEQGFKDLSKIKHVAGFNL